VVRDARFASATKALWPIPSALIAWGTPFQSAAFQIMTTGLAETRARREVGLRSIPCASPRRQVELLEPTRTL
jgi:hypothetical protein